MKRQISVHAGSSNVFADLDLENAQDLTIQAELTRLIYVQIKRRGLTQVQAGLLLGLKQPDISKLMKGRYAGFSAERLLRCLNALDQDIEIVVRQKPAHARRNAGLSVVAA